MYIEIVINTTLVLVYMSYKHFICTQLYIRLRIFYSCHKIFFINTARYSRVCLATFSQFSLQYHLKVPSA